MQLIINKGKIVDNIGNVLDYKGEKDYGVKGKYHPIPLELAETIIEDIKFPLWWLDIPLFLFPYRLMLYKDYWCGTEYNGRAYPTHIIYGARLEIPTKESIGSLIIHEIGHALCYKFVDPNFRDYTFTDKFKEYMQLRDIERWSDKSIWQKRPSELWAEDFRYLFGTEYMKQEEFLHYKYIDPPGKEIKKFMLDLIGGEEMGRFKQYTVEQYLDILVNTNIVREIKEVHLHHTWKPTIEDYVKLENKEDSIWSMWRHHTETRGFVDIAQHVTVAPDGTIWTGRDVNIDPASIKGHNKGAYMIEMIGNFDIGHEKLEGAQLDALIKLMVELFKIFKGAKLVFHREYSTKTCPGTSIDKEVLLKMIEENKFPINLSEWAKDGYNFVKESGISDGTRPKDTLTREEMWTMLHRYHQKYGKENQDEL